MEVTRPGRRCFKLTLIFPGEKRTMELILTLDYEIFGKGSGDVFEHMIRPTDEFLKICNREDVKVTIFFEVLEYLKIKEEWDSGNKMGYERDPLKAIETQLQYAYRDGHDIQLHLHPQWVNAKYENGWEVDKKYWRLPLVNREECGYSIEDLLRIGKETIEHIIRSLDDGYRCNILRAADFNIYPSGEICQAMRSTGIIADSSIIPGAHADDGYSLFDYGNIPASIPYWFVNDDNLMNFNESSRKSDSIVELPIFAMSLMRVRKFDYHRIRIKMRNARYALRRLRQKTDNKGFRDTIKYYFTGETVPWDFSLCSRWRMKDFYSRASEIEKDSGYRPHPFVLIGHSKEFMHRNSFIKFLKFAGKRNVKFITLAQAVEALMEKA